SCRIAVSKHAIPCARMGRLTTDGCFELACGQESVHLPAGDRPSSVDRSGSYHNGTSFQRKNSRIIVGGNERSGEERPRGDAGAIVYAGAVQVSQLVLGVDLPATAPTRRCALVEQDRGRD